MSMKFEIQNRAGGGRRNFRTLTGAARFVAQNPVFGGYEIAGASPDSDREAVQAVIQYAESARREIGRNDWPSVVEQCIRWSEPEPEEDDGDQSW